MKRSRPNILFILADDLGWNDLSVEGSAYYESPNIDRIANEGMRFTQGYAACQVCSPSRASILTGRCTPRHGITDWIGAPCGEAWRRLERFNRLLPADYEHALRPDEVTLAHALGAAGYRTFFAGKWHLGGEGSYPEDRGFDINLGGFSAGSPPGGYFAPYKNPKLPDGPPGESLPIRLGRETARFIEGQGRDPFLAYLSFYSVHGPIQTSRDRWERFRQKARSAPQPERRFLFDRNLPVRQVQDCPIYAGMIQAMDDAVGIVLDALERTGQADNTIVCFTSDNGGVSSGDSFSTACLPLRGGKGRQWEGGIREPFHIRAPGTTRPGSLCDVPVSHIDVYPTLLALAGVPMPAGPLVDGRSLVPLLRGEGDEAIETRDLFWHYPHYGNQGGEPGAMMRSGPWKLIHYYEDGRDELYDLTADPGEQHNLAAADPGRIADMRQRLDAWLAETGARIPIPDPEHDAARERQRLRDLETQLMARLETQHAQYLDPAWQPNADWWGSQITVD
ncbi:MAG: sulfatase [Lentisphaeria bacterium]|nr:sulfatase [Lentisphaeria bacterium]